MRRSSRSRDARRRAAVDGGRRWPAGTPSPSIRSPITARRDSRLFLRRAPRRNRAESDQLKALRVIAVGRRTDPERRPAANDPAGPRHADHWRRADQRATACASPCTSSTARPVSYLWSESVDAPLGDPFAGAGTRRQRRRREAGTAAARCGKAPRRAPASDNLAARNLYLQGRYHLNQRTEEGLHKARRLLREGDRRGCAVRARAQRPGRRLRAARALRRARPAPMSGRKAASSAASAVMLDGRCAEAQPRWRT